ncbi:MAG TPA: DUF721 domain-containing protein [Gammaproteobacteria bacterium]|nr:DUF721 domain-containing protein [Gammaproteobacteria bacterium]
MNSRTPSHNPFLAPQGKVADLITRARHFQRLARQVLPLLGDELASHCRVASLERQVLVLIVDSPGWASRIRFQGPQIQRDLAATGLPVQSIEVRVSPPEAPPVAEKPDPIRPLSEHSAKCLEALANSHADSPLGAALRRLARHRRAPDRKDEN